MGYQKGNALHKQVFDNKRRIIYCLYHKYDYDITTIADAVGVSKAYVYHVMDKNKYFLQTAFNYHSLGWSL
jgi:predicted DNA-binding protein YlxM (UPF0122 family)